MNSTRKFYSLAIHPPHVIGEHCDDRSANVVGHTDTPERGLRRNHLVQVLIVTHMTAYEMKLTKMSQNYNRVSLQTNRRNRFRWRLEQTEMMQPIYLESPHNKTFCTWRNHVGSDLSRTELQRLIASVRLDCTLHRGIHAKNET